MRYQCASGKFGLIAIARRAEFDRLTVLLQRDMVARFIAYDICTSGSFGLCQSPCRRIQALFKASQCLIRGPCASKRPETPDPGSSARSSSTMASSRATFVSSTNPGFRRVSRSVIRIEGERFRQHCVRPLEVVPGSVGPRPRTIISDHVRARTLLGSRASAFSPRRYPASASLPTHRPSSSPATHWKSQILGGRIRRRRPLETGGFDLGELNVQRARQTGDDLVLRLQQIGAGGVELIGPEVAAPLPASMSWALTLTCCRSAAPSLPAYSARPNPCRWPWRRPACPCR